jgi:hypothetical protein
MPAKIVDGVEMELDADDLAQAAADAAALAAAQAATRRLIAKSVVQERVNALGKWAAVAALLYTNGLPNIYYARWFAPDWPQVYADDPSMLALLTYAGLTADEIATVTAPA